MRRISRFFSYNSDNEERPPAPQTPATTTAALNPLPVTPDTTQALPPIPTTTTTTTQATALQLPPVNPQVATTRDSMITRFRDLPAPLAAVQHYFYRRYGDSTRRGRTEPVYYVTCLHGAPLIEVLGVCEALSHLYQHTRNRRYETALQWVFRNTNWHVRADSLDFPEFIALLPLAKQCIPDNSLQDWFVAFWDNQPDFQDCWRSDLNNYTDWEAGAWYYPSTPENELPLHTWAPRLIASVRTLFSEPHYDHIVLGVEESLYLRAHITISNTPQNVRELRFTLRSILHHHRDDTAGALQQLQTVMHNIVDNPAALQAITAPESLPLLTEAMHLFNEILPALPNPTRARDFQYRLTQLDLLLQEAQRQIHTGDALADFILLILSVYPVRIDAQDINTTRAMNWVIRVLREGTGLAHTITQSSHLMRIAENIHIGFPGDALETFRLGQLQTRLMHNPETLGARRNLPRFQQIRLGNMLQATAEERRAATATANTRTQPTALAQQTNPELYREAAMAGLTEREANLREALLTRYTAQLSDEEAVEGTIEAIRTYCLSLCPTLEPDMTLPQANQRRLNLGIYYQDEPHTAYRYLSNPSPLIHPNARFTRTVDGRPLCAEISPQDRLLIATFWLALGDETFALSTATFLQDSTNPRLDAKRHFVGDLAFLGRAHNIDNGPDTYTIADHPSCRRGIEKRFFTSIAMVFAISDNPELRHLDEDTAKETLWNILWPDLSPRLDALPTNARHAIAERMEALIEIAETYETGLAALVAEYNQEYQLFLWPASLRQQAHDTFAERYGTTRAQQYAARINTWLDNPLQGYPDRLSQLCGRSVAHEESRGIRMG